MAIEAVGVRRSMRKAIRLPFIRTVWLPINSNAINLPRVTDANILAKPKPYQKSNYYYELIQSNELNFVSKNFQKFDRIRCYVIAYIHHQYCYHY